VQYSRRSLLKSLLPSTDISSDLGEPSRGTYAGRLDVRNRQDLLWVYPSTQVRLSQRSSLFLGGDYSHATYDQQTLGDYVDFSNLSGLVFLGFEVSPRGTLSLRGSGVKFSPDQGPGSTTYGFQIDWLKRVTETAKYYVRGGVNRTNFERNPTLIPLRVRRTQWGEAPGLIGRSRLPQYSWISHEGFPPIRRASRWKRISCGSEWSADIRHAWLVSWAPLYQGQ